VPRWTRLLIGCCCLTACAVAPTAATAGDGLPAAAARSCPAPAYPGSGDFTSLTVTKVTCSRGTAVLKAHYKCRIAHGRKGKCTKAVLGYRCSEKRVSIPTEFNSRVTCKNGTRRVVYTYQQNT